MRRFDAHDAEAQDANHSEDATVDLGPLDNVAFRGISEAVLCDSDWAKLKYHYITLLGITGSYVLATLITLVKAFKHQPTGAFKRHPHLQYNTSPLTCLLDTIKAQTWQLVVAESTDSYAPAISV
jgi:hypothetical protein